MANRLKGLINRFTGDSYEARSFRGSALTVLQFGMQNALRLGSNLLLTRLLFPEAFGMMALVTVLIAGVSMFSVIGIRGAIIQDERGTDPDFLDTAFTLSVLRGVILTLVVIALARPFANFYEEPMLADLLLVSAFTLFFQGFNSIRMHTVQREIMLGRLTYLTLGAQILGLIIMIFLAWWLRSVWALALGTVITAFLTMVATHLFLPGHQEWFGFDRDAVRRIFRFGKWIFLSTIAGFFIAQGDKAVLGKFVTLETLALYNIALMFATLPLAFGKALLERVLYPLYARRPPAESADNRRKIFRARWAVTGVLIVGTTALALIGDPLVVLLYDPRYEAAGAFLVLIALSFLPEIIIMSYEKLPLAAGDSGRFAVFKISHALIMLGLLFLGLTYYGIGGAIASRAVAAVVVYPIMLATIWPYKGWDVWHDLAFTVLFIVICAVTYQLLGSTMAPLFVPEPAQ